MWYFVSERNFNILKLDSWLAFSWFVLLSTNCEGWIIWEFKFWIKKIYDFKLWICKEMQPVNWKRIPKAEENAYLISQNDSFQLEVFSKNS